MEVVTGGQGFSVLLRLAGDCGDSQSDWIRERLVRRLLVWATTKAVAGQESGQETVEAGGGDERTEIILAATFLLIVILSFTA